MFNWWPWRFKTVDEIRVWWKLWSIRLGLVGSAITGWLVSFPDQAVGLWAAMPYEIRQFIPANYMPLIGVFLFLMSMVSRFIKQHKAAEVLAEKKAEDVAVAKQAIQEELSGKSAKP